MIKKTLPVFVLPLLLISPLAVSATLTMNGIEGEVRKNVDAYLETISAEDYSTSLRFQARLERIMTEAVNALGYYHPEFDFQLINNDQDLQVDISLGEPVLVEKADIDITGEAGRDPQFNRLIRESGIVKGERLNHGQYDALKSAIQNLALQKGYFKGEFTVSRLEVAPDLNQAFIRLHYKSGIRYQFGNTQIVNTHIDPERVKSLSPYQAGDAYLASKVGEYNQNLSNTDWFSSVFVEPDLTQLDQQRQLPMKVTLAPQARNQIETGIGYATDVGVRGSLKWKKPWLNSRGHSFDSSFLLSIPEQTITASYRIPLEDVLNDYYRVKYGMKKVDKNDTNSLESNLALERHWTLDNGWHRTLYIRYLLESYTQGLLDDTGQFVLPGISFSRTRSRGGLMPNWGDKQSVTVEYGDPAVISETRLVRLLASTAWVRSIGKNHRGVFRLDAGANLTENFEKLPPSLRFFTGGDNSVRGYGYETISPKDPSGALAGAKHMVATSLEYQYRLYGDWWGALFYDVGDAFNEIPELKRGTGFGIRWASPVGPVRFDFAWGLDAEPKPDFQIHFTLGPEL
ncbi:autotransporter assembly complex protein TamA [Vibrio sp.]|uniref:autotransporter assembly complex protein TamA n=1 Tax=Vibrio sp. TaxID=678 RepID=UPI003D1056BE